MNQEKTNKENESKNEGSDGRLKSFKLFDERMQKRRRKASMGRLITLIVALIVIILLWFWARTMGR